MFPGLLMQRWYCTPLILMLPLNPGRLPACEACHGYPMLLKELGHEQVKALMNRVTSKGSKGVDCSPKSQD